jgi:hypothetical protein
LTRIVIAEDKRDAFDHVSPSRGDVIVTVRNFRTAGRGCVATDLTITDRARSHSKFLEMLVTMEPTFCTSDEKVRESFAREYRRAMSAAIS